MQELADWFEAASREAAATQQALEQAAQERDVRAKQHPLCTPCPSCARLSCASTCALCCLLAARLADAGGAKNVPRCAAPQAGRAPDAAEAARLRGRAASFQAEFAEMQARHAHWQQRHQEESAAHAQRQQQAAVVHQAAEAAQQARRPTKRVGERVAGGVPGERVAWRQAFRAPGPRLERMAGCFQNGLGYYVPTAGP